MLNRSDILSKKDLKKEKVNVSEWGGDVFVSEMTGEVKDQWEQEIIRREENLNLKNPRAKLVVATVVDEKGEPLFSFKDVDQIGKLSAAALNCVCEVAQRMNGLSDESLEEIEGNS